MYAIQTNGLTHLADRVFALMQEYPHGFTYDPAYDSLSVPDGWYVGGFCPELPSWLAYDAAGVYVWLAEDFEPAQQDTRLYIAFDGEVLDGVRHFRPGRRAVHAARAHNQWGIGEIRDGEYVGTHNAASARSGQPRYYLPY